jgi:hypothetical protein
LAGTAAVAAAMSAAATDPEGAIATNVGESPRFSL